MFALPLYLAAGEVAMFHQQSSRWRADQMHGELRVRIKGDDVCKQLTSKLTRTGVEVGNREVSQTGRPYFEYRIIVCSPSQYAKVFRIIESTVGVELLE